MSETTSGAFTSRWDAEDWEHDDETGGLVQFLRADDDVQAGLWRPGETAGRPIELELVAHETVLVLAGTGTLEVDGGPAIPLAQGDMVSLRKGARTRWVLDGDFKEFWVYSDPES